MNNAQSSKFLSLREIAAWTLPSVSRGTSKVVAKLPALQRGAVWRAPQDEALWDSVLRGFPIGSFLLAEFDEDRKRKDLKYQEPGVPGVIEPDPTHHLLDGQQRSNAIALGFLNPWNMKSPPAALWIDLKKPEPNDEREFVLRELTRSHPWGYPLSGDAPRLSSDMIRKAVTAYKEASPSLVNESGGQIPLTHAWPWNAYAPVPLCFLLDAVDSSDDVGAFLLERLSQLPFWGSKVSTSFCTPDGETWQQRVSKILKATSGSDFEYLVRLIRSVKSVLSNDEDTSYQIAALVVAGLTAVPTGGAPNKTDPNGNEVPMDPLETLFIRINRGGTRLDGEELNYSILKSIWPEAERFINDMKFQLASPSRIVALASRLVLSDAVAFRDEPPPLPKVAQFRRLIHGLDRNCKSFYSRLRSFFEKGNAKQVFRAFHDILTKNKHCALPPTLAADISPNVMFLLLRWVQRIQKEGHEPEELNKVKTLRLVGAITALSWFSAEDSNTGAGKFSLDALWGALQKAIGDGLLSFFSRQQFARSFKLTRSKFGLLPLVPPDKLEDAIKANVLGRGFGSKESESWKNWDWDTLTNRDLGEKRFGKKLQRWYTKSFEELWQSGDPSDEGNGIEDDGDLENLYKQAWRLFVGKLWDEKALLLFAQREWLVSWLAKAKYDPTSAEQTEESNRPWDYDHIHPYAYIKATTKVPWKIKDWHGSIGNLRAWPLSENRSDGDSSPRDKFKFSGELEDEGLKQFCIESEEELHEASFVDAKNFVDWNLSTPEDEASEDEARRYLGNPEFGEQRKHLVQAIIGRWLSLYRHWYETLKIEDLCP